jgi:hypothetical protein
MNNQKVHINYTCDKTWDSLCSTNSVDIKYCGSCKKNVGDFTQGKVQNTSCGTFNISQVQLFKRNFLISATSVPLITLLGLSISPNQLLAQEIKPSNSQQTIDVAENRDFLKIRGNIVDKESKKPLEYGVMEVFMDNEMIAVTIVQKGLFRLDIDTSQFQIENLSVYFYNTDGLTSDTTKIQNPSDQKFLIEMDVQMDYNSKHLSMTGDYITVDPQSEITCTLKPIEPKKEKRRRSKRR